MGKGSQRRTVERALRAHEEQLMREERESMIRLPLICPRCHHAFLSNTYVSPDAIEVVIDGNGAGSDPCPDCGTSVPAVGRWQLVQAVRETARIVLDERPPAAELERLISALRSGTEGNGDVAQAIHDTAASPRLEAWFRRNPGLAALVGILLGGLLSLLANMATQDHDQAVPTPATVRIDGPGDEELSRLVEDEVDRRLREMGTPAATGQNPEQPASAPSQGGGEEP